MESNNKTTCTHCNKEIDLTRITVTNPATGRAFCSFVCAEMNKEKDKDNMKQYDVHFTLKFNNFIGFLEAQSEKDAKKQAREFLENPESINGYISDLIANNDYEIRITDALEVEYK